LSFSQIYLYIIIGLLQLASKRVLSGSDYLKLDGGWGFAQTPLGELQPHPLAAFRRGPTSKYSTLLHCNVCATIKQSKSRFLQVKENWKKSGNLSGQGKVRENFFLEKSRKMKNWCHQMSDFRGKMHAPPQTLLGELRALPRPTSCT